MYEEIIEPTLVINKSRCIANIRRMADKAHRHNLILRPHFKTHQSEEVGKWFRELGIEKITVSSVKMAHQFANLDWKDITIAFPLNPREMPSLNAISNDVIINLTIENKEALHLAGEKFQRNFGVFIKIDAGYKRTGINFNDYKAIDELINHIRKYSQLDFKGFIIHAGHTYNCRGKDEVLKVHEDSLEIISKLKQYYTPGFPELIISYGDTPSSSLAEDFSNIDEIRPGNFVFYDLMQWQIGSCKLEDIAVSVACPIVAKHPERHEVIIQGGAVHLSKDFLIQNEQIIWGIAAAGKNNNNRIFKSDAYIHKISQEHGILKVTNNIQFSKYRIGDLAFIIPVHSCLTANLQNKILII